MFDTDTLQWVSDWTNTKSVINSTDLSIPLVCRSNNFYVDVYSESLIELGTRQYPYKSIRTLFVELINHHSNQDKSVTIYLKENQKHYMEDGTNYILNITNVTITTYTDEQAILFKAKFIPTGISQSALSQKTAFSLLSNTSLKLDDIITEGGYTESENSQLNNNRVTLYTVRSNTYIDNIDVQRDSSDIDKSTIFLYIVYLQDKIIQMTNMDINITGTIANGIDPFNGFFENITIDAYALRRGMEFQTLWDYPEATLQSELLFNNIKTIRSSDTSILFSPNIIMYFGPGNMTIKNSDFTEFFNTVVEVRPTLGYVKQGGCQPNDGIIQTIIFDNVTTSVLDNPQANRFNVLILSASGNLYRDIKAFVQNSTFVNYENIIYAFIFISAQQLIELSITDCKMG